MRKGILEVIAHNKWLVLFVAWGAVIVTMHLRHGLGIQPIQQKRVIKTIVEEVEPEAPAVTINHYDVILNSYMRSGSTLTGIILGWRNDTFYLYEPLWKISRWTYWHGNSTVCRADKLECRKIPPGKDIMDSRFVNNKGGGRGGSNVMARTILRKIYDCQFNDFENQVMEKNIAVRLGGPSWEAVHACMKGGVPSKEHEKMCLHKHAPNRCKNARHRVSKVLRMTVDNFDDLLRTRKNLKVVHLFRDPRAIVNSRLTTNWFPTNSDQQLFDNAETICNKMVKDFKEGLNLLKKYPDRFKFLYYEDLTDGINEKVKMLYKYLKMSLDPARYKKVTSLSVFKTDQQQSERQKNTAFWWRKSLSWDVVQRIDGYCGEVYALLGYKKFETKEEMENLTIPSVDIPEEYLLSNDS